MTLTEARPRPAAHDDFPLYPPADWFDLPGWLEPLQKLTIVTHGPEAGRVAAYVAPWDQCLIDGTDECWTAPSSPSGYANAHQGDTMTLEGDIVRTANLGGGVNHARVAAGFREAAKHYHSTAAQMARVRYGENEHGIYLAGAAWPDVTDAQVAILRASAVSGDWRFLPHLGGFDLCGVQLVNTPGYPLIRRAARAAAYSWDLSGVVYVGGLGGAAPLEEGDDDEHECEACATRHAGMGTVEQRLADVEAAIAELAAR